MQLQKYNKKKKIQNIFIIKDKNIKCVKWYLYKNNNYLRKIKNKY